MGARITTVCVLVALVLPTVARAQNRVRSQQRVNAGIVSIIAGTGLVLGAFNYKRECDGYRSQFRDGLESYDYCTTFSDRSSITENTPWDISLARPPMLYTGLGAVALGVLLTTIMADVPGAPGLAIAPTPGGARVTASVGF